MPDVSNQLLEATQDIQPLPNAAVVPPPVRTQYVLSMLYRPGDSIERPDELLIVNELKKISSKPLLTDIVLVLNSHGGNVYAAVKILNLIRSKCSSLIIVVPRWAKSSATLMALGADKIVMGCQSELGPLDKPIEHPHLEGVTVSALDVVNSLSYLQDRAKKLTKEIAEEYVQEFGLTRKDALEVATKLSLGLTTPILAKEDPRIINQSLRLLLIAERYGKTFLENYMFKNQNWPNKERLIKIILDILIWQFPDHAYAITRNEAKEILLEIVDAESFPEWQLLWDHFESLSGTKVIRLQPSAEIFSLPLP